MSLRFPLRDRPIETDLPAFVMGIVNATPDSFWESSRAASAESCVELALSMAADGADIIDVGGESTRPGSAYVDEETEIARVVPVIRGIRARSGVPISVDTRKAAVMRAALDAGADVCNDISALEDDPTLAALVAEARIPVVLMHKRGSPQTMQTAPKYRDAVREVADYLFGRARYAESAGVAREKIILDPGIGFGKRYEDNLSLIAGLAEMTRGGYPVLMALSRKSCVGTMTGRSVDDRLAGTLAANVLAVQRGATFVRVHDVRETRDSLSVLKEITAFGNH